MSLFKRLEGIFFSPRPTFEGLAAKPVWIDAVVIALVALIAFNFVILPYAQKENLALLKDNAALRERMGEDNYARMVDATENPSPSRRVIQTFVMPPMILILGLLLQSLMLFIGGRIGSTQGTYVQVLSALAHAGLVNSLLGNAVRLVLILTRQSVLQTSTSLALLFPRLEVTSTPYIILTQIDFFQLWMFGILAFGLAAIFKVSVRKAMTLSYSIWLIKAVVNIALGLVAMSFMR